MAVDYSIAFWIVLILLLLLLIAALIVGVIQSSKTPQSIDSQFRFLGQSAHNHLSETGLLNFFVHITYSANVKNDKIATRADVLNTINTTPALVSATNTELWERMAQDITNQIWSNFDCYGISVEIVIPQTSADVSKSTTVAATFTKGYINRALKLESSQN